MSWMKFKEEHKKMSFKRFLNSFKYSLEGLCYAYANEQSLWIHALGSCTIVFLGFLLQVSFNQWAILIIALVVVLAVELLNTAIEAAVDLVTEEIHPLAKIAKDCGSAAAFVTAMMLTVICLFIFIPKIVAFLR